jgi:EmrB/QacA subfamily drug resistance transporter
MTDEPMIEQGEATPPQSRNRWIGMALLSVGVAMIIVDATIVNVAIPSIIRDLKIPITTAEWVNTMYALVFAALLIAVGRVGDLVGRRKMFAIGIALFVVASMLAGIAPSGAVLLAARFLQGIGGAIILPSTLSSVNAIFRGRERAIAFGIWGSVIGGMAAFGPLLGGWLTTAASWRWAFYINLPIGLVVLLGTFRFVPETRDEHAVLGFDLGGVLTSAVGLGLLVFGLIEGQTYGWWRPDREFHVGPVNWNVDGISPIPVAFVLSAVLLAAFLVIESRRRAAGKVVLLDFALFRIKAFRYGNIAALIVSLGELGLIFVLPLFLQSVLGYSALRTGEELMFLAAGAFVAGPTAAQFALRFGSRPVVAIGMATEAAAIALIGVVLSTTVTGPELAPFLFLYGLGVGLATAQLTNVILVDVPQRESGQASGTQSTFRQVGSALGIAILGTILVVTLGSQTRARLSEVPMLPLQAVDGISTAVQDSAGAILTNPCSFAPNPTQCTPDTVKPIVDPIREAFVAAAKRVAAVGTIFVLGGVVATLLLPKRPPIGRERAEAAGGPSTDL